MMALLRTWSNGWFTTHRTQAKNNGGIKLPCIFGCDDEEDSLHHYICCELLWTLIISCTFNQTSLLHLPAANKICLVNPNSVNISLWVMASQVYHAVRNTYSHEINFATQQSDFSHIAMCACALLYIINTFGAYCSLPGNTANLILIPNCSHILQEYCARH